MDREKYAQYCYFNQAARNVIFTEQDEENPIVRNYRLDLGRHFGAPGWLDGPKDAKNPVRYVIEKEIPGQDRFTASLAVRDIRLKLFSTGVGMIVFDLENYEYGHLQQICRINEWGRRMFMPYMDETGRCPLCADTITLTYPGCAVTGTVSGALPDSNSGIRVMEPILFLLRGQEYSATTDPRHGGGQFYIEPIIDDRMFTACVWNNGEFAAEMAQESDGQYRYLADARNKTPDAEDNAARKLYELMFIDGTGLSCQSRTMLRRMLENHIYDRWLEYGTLTGVTEYSMVCVTGFPPNIATFRNMYTEMAMLVLAQRASLLAFERQISDCAQGKLRIDRIQRQYVLFQSKLLLREVTPQQQGIELYDMLLENLFIHKEKDDVESQVNALFALAANESEQADNILLFALTALGITDAVSFFTAEQEPLTLGLSLGGIAVLLAWFLYNHRKRTK